MSTRVVLAWMFVSILLPVSSHAIVSKQHGAQKLTATKPNEPAPKPCRSSLLEIQNIYGRDHVPAAARKQLVDRLNCLRDQEMVPTTASEGAEHEIRTLEGMAKDDLQQLTDVTIPSLEKVKSSGADVDKALAETRQALQYLSPVVAISKEGKAELRPSHFLDLRAANDAAKTRMECVDLQKSLPIKDVSDVQVCLDELAMKIVAAHGDAAAYLRNRRNLVEELGARMSKSKTEKLKDLHDKRDAAKTPTEKDGIDKQLKALEQDLKTLDQIAIAPASRRTCLQPNPPRPDDALSVERCIVAVKQVIDEVRLRHLPPLNDRSEIRLAELRLARARVEDEKIRYDHLTGVRERLDVERRSALREATRRRLEDEISRLDLQLPDDVIVTVHNVPECGAGPRCRLKMSETDHVRQCLAGLDDAIAQADAHDDAVDVALDAHLEPLRSRIEVFEDIGSTIAEQRNIELVTLKPKIDDAKDDAVERARLTALQKAAKDDFALLDRIAVTPSLRRRCADDPEIPQRLLEWKDPARAAQCIVAVSNRIDQIKTANPEPRDRATDRTLARLYSQLDRVELAGRQIAAIGGTATADAQSPKSDAKSASAPSKADSGSDSAAAQSSADLAALTALAIEPIERRACVGDPNRHLKIEGGVMIARCIEALSAAIENMQFNRDQPPMDDHERNQKLSELSLQLARFQEAGRRVLKLKSSQLADMRAQHDATQDDAARQKIDEDEKAVKAEIKALNKGVITQGADPVTEFADYEQWFNKLSMGYEYAGATDAFSKGFPRIGAMIGFHYPRQLVPDFASSFHFGGYGVYNMFTIWLTNSGEATPTPLAKTFISTASRAAAIRALDTSGDPDTGTTGSTPKQPTLTRAVEFEYQIFWPWWRNDFQAVNPRLRTTVGPLVVLGARKLDSDTFAHDRVYVGLRNARSPDTFYDFLYGRTGGLVSHRIELRGQYALPLTFKNNARLALGGVGNFGINKRRHGDCAEAAPSCRPDENDSIRFYLSYDIGGSDFLKFFGGSDTTK
jgi:hypothetical protein